MIMRIMRMLLPSSSFGIVTTTVFVWLLCKTVTASSYNAYKYDMTTPMFTPDGRLLQVEYACRAASHSSPLVVLKGKDGIVIMVSKSSHHRRHCGQDRLVVFGDDRGVIIAMSGVLSDSIRLLTIVQEESERELRRYGTTLSCQQIATIVGDSCQLHAFGGGMRPYGSTMIICDNSCNVWQTDPSGAVVALRGMVGEDDGDDTAVVISVVGGTDAMQAKLQKDIILKKDANLPETLVAMAKVLLQTDKEDESKRGNNEWLEVAILSPLHGVHRLTDTQIQSLIQATKEKKSPKK